MCSAWTTHWENGYEPLWKAFFEFIKVGITGPYYCPYCWNRRTEVDEFDAPLA